MASGIFEYTSTPNLVALHDAVVAALINKTNRVIASVGLGDTSTSKVEMIPTKDLLDEITTELGKRGYQSPAGVPRYSRTRIRYTG